MNRGLAGSWSIGLGLLAGAIAATFVPARTPGEEVRFIAAFTLVFTPALFVITTRQWDLWRRTNGYVRFAVYTLSFLVAGGILVRVTVALFGPYSASGRAAAFVAVMVAFAFASWLTFYGGADRAWKELVERFDIDW